MKRSYTNIFRPGLDAAGYAVTNEKPADNMQNKRIVCGKILKLDLTKIAYFFALNQESQSFSKK